MTLAQKPSLQLTPDQPAAPRLVTELPGPRARVLADRDELVLSPSYTRDYELVVDRAIGCVVIDVDGNHFLDMTAGIAVTAAGHCHPHVVAAIRNQSERLLHMCGADFYYEQMVLLAERLAAAAPMTGANRVLFTNSGAEAIEAAFKLARHHTGRKHCIAFWGAFHGRTFGALSLSGSKSVHRSRFTPLVPEVTHVTYPNPYRPASEGDPVEFTLDEIRNHVFRRKVPPDEVAAIFVEPIQGEGGYIIPPPGFLPALRELCDEHGILLVVDEIQTGMGRTGRMWAVQHVGVEPDILTSAKGLAGGLPLGAIIARSSIMDWPPGSHASTFGGNPVSCAASLATMDLLEAGLIRNAEAMGRRMLGRLRPLGEVHDVVGDVRGLGLMCCVELVTDRASKKPATALRDALTRACFGRGLLTLACGESAVRFVPPLCVTAEQIDLAASIFSETLADVTLERGAER